MEWYSLADQSDEVRGSGSPPALALQATGRRGVARFVSISKGPHPS